MKHGKIFAIVILVVLLASPALPVSAQIGFTLSGGSVSAPLFGQESTLYSELVIESFFDKNTGTYLLSGAVNKASSAIDFSGNYDPATRQVNGQYFLSLTASSDEKGSEIYTLNGSFSGSIDSSGSTTLLLAGTIKYDKWNYAVDKDGNPVYKWAIGLDENQKPKYEYYLEKTETNADNRHATFNVTGDTSQVIVPGSTPGEFFLATEEPTGDACSPQPRGLNPAKPGDVISPGADYLDASGKAVGIIQERWFLNGINTNSIPWDGKQVLVELQYTCLDHKGYSKTYTIPAYQEAPASLPLDEPASAPPEEPVTGSGEPAPSGGTSPGSIAAIIAIVVGVLGAATVGIGQVLKNNPGKEKTPVPPTQASPSPAPGVPVETAAPVPTNLPSQAAPSSPAKPEPMQQSPSGQQNLTPEELGNIRDEMQAEIGQIKNRWRETRDAVEKLKTLKKKNLLKFLMKQGLEVNDWVVNSPVEVINKVVGDPVMEQVFEKHDTSQDDNIVVQIHNRIQSLEGEMQEMIDQARHLQIEINKINQTLGQGGGG